MRQAFVCLLLLGATCLAQAQTEPRGAEAVRQTRERIAADRTRIAEVLAEQERGCYQRFAVNDCLREARRQQRDALAVLRREEIALNAEERRRREAERVKRLQARQAEAAAAPASAAKP
ncbi:hypothetical protein [Ramlibacter sp. 2FC]|uniref:hypothetical protein n=1 Tax=Ramlibacter sp. 2FC TaxID=2502188 RepID=UPI0010F58729|nr:hypothetical protein [Ramlibacter sp. 2FC]